MIIIHLKCAAEEDTLFLDIWASFLCFKMCLHNNRSWLWGTECMVNIVEQDPVKANKPSATEIRIRTPLTSYTLKQHIDDLACARLEPPSVLYAILMFTSITLCPSLPAYQDGSAKIALTAPRGIVLDVKALLTSFKFLR